MQAPAGAFAQEILHPALYHAYLHGRRRRLKHLLAFSRRSRTERSLLSFCPPANIQTIRESIPNARVRNESCCNTHSSLFTSCFTSLLSMPEGCGWAGICWLDSYHPIAFRKSNFCKPRNYSSKSEGIWIRDAVATNTSHGVWDCGRDPRPSRIQGFLPSQVPSRKWPRGSPQTLCLSERLFLSKIHVLTNSFEVCIWVQVCMCLGTSVAVGGQMSGVGSLTIPRGIQDGAQVLRSEFKYFDLLSCVTHPLLRFFHTQCVCILTVLYLVEQRWFLERLTRLFGQTHPNTLTCDLNVWTCPVCGWLGDSRCVHNRDTARDGTVSDSPQLGGHLTVHTTVANVSSFCVSLNSELEIEDKVMGSKALWNDTHKLLLINEGTRQQIWL